MLTEVREDMMKIVQLLGRAKVGIETQDTEQDVINALQEILDAIKKQQQKQKKQKPKSGKPKEQKEQKPGQQKLIDNLTELKFIYRLQKRVADRTERYPKADRWRRGPARKDCLAQ